MKPFLALLLVLTSCPSVFSQNLSKIEQGRVDLTNWDFSRYPMIALDGQWEFYWNKLLLSKDLDSQPKRSFAELSIPWNEQLIEGQYFPHDGCATYALTIVVPQLDSVAFAVPAVFNSYAFWVNDQLVCSSGTVATTPEKMMPQWRPRTVSVANPHDTLRVIFQIANFQHTRGGCAELMRFGTTTRLEQLDEAYRTSGMALIILFFVASLIGLIIFFLVRSQGFLFLSFLALAYTLRFLFSDLYFYYDFGIEMPWAWAARIEYSTIPLIVLTASLFIAALYPQEFKRGVLYFSVGLNTLLLIATIVAPSEMLSPLVVVLQVAGLSFVLYAIYVILKALIFPRTGAWVSALGTAVFALVGFYNIYAFITLIDLNRTVIHTGYAVALILNVISLLYRTPMRLRTEEEDMLRFSDLYDEKESVRI
jgi:hypothetical protein